MVPCKICNKKFVSQGKYEKHYSKVHVEPTEVETEVKVEPVEVETEVVVPEVKSEKITLRFKAPIEVAINSVPYVGRIVEAPNMNVAAEIVRLVRDSNISRGLDGDVLER